MKKILEFIRTMAGLILIIGLFLACLLNNLDMLIYVIFIFCLMIFVESLLAQLLLKESDFSYVDYEDYFAIYPSMVIFGILTVFILYYIIFR